MKVVSAITSTLFWTIYAVFFCLSMIISAANYQTAQLPFYSFIVQTASMEPTIMTGDVIFIKPQTAYSVTDIVTFKDSENRTITHRIIAQNETDKTFTTKGDNNKTEDPEPITVSQIIGKHLLHLPKVGYVLVYAQRPTSVFLLIAIPIVMLLAGEFFKTKPEKHDSKKL